MVFPDNQFSSKDVDILERKTVYQGFFRMEKLRLRHRLFDGGWSEPIVRELFVRGTAVGVLPYDPKNRLVGLIEQFRIGAIEEDSNPWLLELVAGMCDAGEDPQCAAHRELQEEAGLTNVELHSIGECWVSPGGTNEKIHLYCGVVDLENAGGTFGLLEEESEDIRFHVVPEDAAFEAMERGRCNNSATMIGLLWLQQNRHKLEK